MKKFILYSSIFAIALSATQVFGEETATNNIGPDTTSTQTPISQKEIDGLLTEINKLMSLQQEEVSINTLSDIADNLKLFPDSTKDQLNGVFTPIVNGLYSQNSVSSPKTAFVDLFSSLGLGLTGPIIQESQSSFKNKLQTDLQNLLENRGYSGDITDILRQIKAPDLTSNVLSLANQSFEEFSRDIDKAPVAQKATIIGLLNQATLSETSTFTSSLFKESGGSINTLISNITSGLNSSTPAEKIVQNAKILGTYINISAAVMANSSKDSDAYKNAAANLTNILTIANNAQVGLGLLKIPQDLLKDSTIKGLFDTNKTISSSTQPNSPAIPGQQTNTPATTQNQTSGQPAFSQTGSVY